MNHQADARFRAIASESLAGRVLRPIVDGWAETWPDSGLCALVSHWSRIDRQRLRRLAVVMLVAAAVSNAIVTGLAGNPITAVEWGGRALVVLIALFLVLRVTNERA